MLWLNQVVALQVIEELGSRGASVQHLRKVVMSEGLLKPLSPQSRVFGGGDWCREGSPVFVACLSAEGLSRWGEPAVSMVAGKLACCCKAMPGTHQALQQMCDSKPVIPKAVALHGTRLLDDCGQPTSGEMRDAQQLAVVAMRCRAKPRILRIVGIDVFFSE